MKVLCVRGGNRLAGELLVSGSKNAALPILAASLLLGGESVISRVPAISDVDAMLLLLSEMGARSKREGGSVAIDAAGIHPLPRGVKLAKALRGSIYLLAASLAAVGEGRVAKPGGCDLGARPYDLHLEVLAGLGAKVWEEDDEIIAEGHRLRGAVYTYPTVSVGATVSGILAALRAEGETVLHNVALESHVLDLIAFLSAAGAKIAVNGRSIAIEGGERLSPVAHRLSPDMIEASR